MVVLFIKSVLGHTVFEPGLEIFVKLSSYCAIIKKFSVSIVLCPTDFLLVAYYSKWLGKDKKIPPPFMESNKFSSDI